MFKSPLLLIALILTGLVAIWGIIDPAGLARFSSTLTGVLFTSRAWFIMLSVSLLLILCIWLAISPYGKIKLGKDDDEPEFSTVSWLTMLFAAGMGVGLLFWGTAEPLSHFKVIRDYTDNFHAAEHALFVTNFHWGLHAWAIYAVTGLVMAYFSFRKGYPILVSSPIKAVFGQRTWTRSVGWLSDLLAIYAIAIGIGGSIAMGVFQIQSGVESLLGLHNSGLWLAAVIFAVLCLSYILPLMVDLSKGMATLSNTAMAIAGGLLIFVLLTGPTYYIMSAITGSIGDYFASVVPHGFKTYTFFDEKVTTWFQSWTLTFMVWWFAWAPFVGVFIARISKGRTIREYLIGVILVP
ncbi:BCCT family transporter, partial [Thermodesulfobacteriota bacterium]